MCLPSQYLHLLQQNEPATTFYYFFAISDKKKIKITDRPTVCTYYINKNMVNRVGVEKNGTPQVN